MIINTDFLKSKFLKKYRERKKEKDRERKTESLLTLCR